jgi:Na+-transporting NADH:ubiquinone oxidoreductase subunit A
MNTAPLAADPNFIMQGEEENFQFGLDILKKLTDGKVYLSLDGNGKKIAPAFEKASGVEKNTFKGKHPAGNVGVHIHHIKPLGRGELVWTVDAFGVANIGKFFKTCVFPPERIIATAGSSLKERKYFKTILGAPIAGIIQKENIKDSHYRVIIGNVLTGRKTYTEGFVSFYRNTITVIPEGKKERKLLGYFRPGFGVTSFSKTFGSSFFGKKEYEIDTLINGGKRAFVMSASDYEKVMPMDILPVPLMKAIMVEDIEEMEGLGILELIEEDVALCSYMDLSKHDFGKILRDGLYIIEREL